MKKGKFEITDNFKEDQCRLNLQKNGTGIYEYRWRIQGHHPRYVPRKSLLADKITYKAHKKTMNGGVILTIAAIRKSYWIPKLRQIANRVIRNCFGCKRFHATSFTTQQQDILPSYKTTETKPFQVIGTDF